MHSQPILDSSPSFWIQILPLAVLFVGTLLLMLSLSRLQVAIREITLDQTDESINKLVFAIALIIGAGLVLIFGITWLVQSDMFDWFAHTKRPYIRL